MNRNTKTSKNLRKKAGLLAAALVGMGIWAGQGQAGPLSWDHTGAGALGGTGSWTTAATNWWNGSADVAWDNTDAIFDITPGVVTINGGTGVSASSLTFNIAGYTIGANTPATDILTLTGSHTITSNQNAAISAILSGTSGLTTAGAGTLTLSGANNYTGGTTVGAGELEMSGSGTLGNTSGALTINGGALDLNNTNQIVGNLTGTGGTIVNNHSGAAGTVTLTIGNGNNGGGTYAGVIADNNDSGTGKIALTKVGTAAITLSGANTYTGATTINGGTLTLQFGTGNNTSGVINSNSALTLTGTNGTTTLNVLGGATAVVDTQTFNGTTLAGGQASISSTQNSATLTTNLGTLTNNTKSYLNFTLTSGTVTASHALDASNVLLGPWATVSNGTTLQYAALSNATNGTISSYGGATTATAGTLANVTSASTNYTYAAAATVGGILTGNTLRYTGAATTTALGTNSLTLNGLMNAGTGALTISGTAGSPGLVTGANGELDIVTNTQSITISSVISGSGAVVFGGPSAGSLTLSGVNTYTGKTIVQAGTLVAAIPFTNAGVAGPLGAPPAGPNATIDFYNGTAFSYTGAQGGPYSTDRTINLAGNGPGTVSIRVNANDTNFNFGAVTATGTGAKTLALFTGNGGNGDREAMTFSGAIPDVSDGSPLSLQVTFRTQSGSQSYVSLPAGGTFTGPIQLVKGANVTSGYLTIGGTQTNGVNTPGTGTLGGGSYAGAIAVDASTIFYYDSTSNQVLSGVISGLGSLTKGASGGLTLTNANTFSGATTVSSGTLTLNNNLAIQNSALTTGTGVITLGAGVTTPTIGGLNGSTDLASVFASSEYNTVTSLTLNPQTGVTATYSGNIADNGNTMSVVKNGAGTQILSGNNLWTGPTTISGVGGVLQASLPTSFLSLDGGVLQPNNTAASFTRGLATSGASMFQFTANGGGFSALGGQYTINIGGASAQQTWGTTVGTNIVGTLQFGSATSNAATLFQNPIDLNGATRTVNVTAGTGADSTEMSGVLSSSSGTAGLTKTGTGTLILSANNTYNGLTTVNGGRLILSGNNTGNGGATLTSGTLQANNAGALGSSGNITFGGGTLQYTSLSAGQDWATRFKSTSAIILDTINQSVTLAGVIDSSNTNGLTKNGWGTLTLTGANAYTGATTVNAGKMVIGNGTTGTLANTAVTVSSGTLQLSTAGAVSQNTVNVNGTGSFLTETVANALGGTAALTVTSGIASLSQANNYSGATTVTGGILMVGSDTAIGGNLTFNGSAFYGTIQSADSTAHTIGNTLNALTGNIIVGNPVGGTGDMTFSSTAATTLGGNRTFTINNTNTTFAQAFGGANGIIKAGPGTMILTGANTNTGANTVNAGTLRVNMNAGGALANTSTLTLYGGTLAMLGKDSTASAQTIGNVTFGASATPFTAGGSGISVTGGASGGTMNLTVGTWTRNKGTTTNITLGSGGTLTSSPLTANNLVVGSGNIAFATVGGTDWAKVSGGTVGGFVSGDYSAPVFDGTDSATVNYGMTDSAFLTNPDTVNTLKINTANPGQSLNLAAQTLTLNAGGLLFVGANDYSITAGTLKGSGGTQKELVVHQYGTGNLTIGAVIPDNGAASALVKTGPGTLTLTGTNTFTGGAYLNGGRLNINSAGALGASTGENNGVTAGLQGSLYVGDGTTISNTTGSALNLSASKINMVWNGSITFDGAADGSKNIYFSPLGMTANNNSAVNMVGNTIVNVTGGVFNVGTHLSGAFSITKNGPGELQAGNGNNVIGFSGGLYINEGTWAGAGNSSAACYGSGVVYLGDITPGSTKNATLAYRSSSGNNNASQGISTNNVVVRAGSSGSLAFVVSNNYSGASANGISGTVTLNNNLTLAAQSNVAQTNTLSGVVGGTGGLNVGDSVNTNIGIVSLTAANTYTGNTTVNSGTLAVAHINALQYSTLDTGAAGSQTVTFTATGTNTYNLGGLQGSHALAIGANSISVGMNGANTAYAGILSSTGGGLTKVGGGTLSLTGANTYTGGTAVNGGSLEIDGGGTLGGGTYAGSIAIASGATFKENSTADQTISGVISGNGAVVKDNFGTLSLSGANTYAGGTTVTNGAVSLQNTSAKPATGTINVGPGATLGLVVGTAPTYFTTTDLASLFANTMPGVNMSSTSNVGIDTSLADFTADPIPTTGMGLTKLGANTLFLGTGNHYSGPTTLSGGTLSISDPSSLGTSSGITFNGGSLQVTGTTMTSLSGSVTLISGRAVGFDIADASNTFTVSQPLTQGAGALNKAGPGTLHLTGANTYSGPTNVTGGTLEIGGGGTLAANYPGNIAISNGATFKYNSSADQTLAGVITGAGTLAKDNTSTLTLTGANNWSGTAQVTGGTLQGTATSIGGNVAVTTPGHLIFNQTSDGSFTKVISGDGGITKTGTATLSLGAAQTYSGGTTISAGTVKLQAIVLTPGLEAQFYSGNDNGQMAQLNTFNSWLAGRTLYLNTTTVAYQGGNGYNPAHARLWYPDAGNHFYDMGFNNAVLPAVDVNNNYTVRLMGKINITQAGSYQFGTNSDDGSMLWVDGQTIVTNNTVKGMADNNNPSSMQATGTISLTAGYHDIVIGMNEGDGGHGLNVAYNGPDTVTDNGAPIGANPQLPTQGNVGGWVFIPNSKLAVLAASGGNNLLPITTTVTMASGTTLDLSNSNQQIASLADAFGATGHKVTNSGTTANSTLTISGTVTTPAATFSGVIQDGTKKISLVKDGPNTQTLTGTNTYSGGTTIDGGTLVAGSNSATGSGDITLNGGTLASATGSITLAGSLVTGTGAHTISPGGDGGIGSLTVGGLSLSANTFLRFDITSPSVYDEINTVGALAVTTSPTIEVPAGLGTGNYKLIGFGSGTVAPDNFVLTLIGGGTAPSGYHIDTTADAGFVDLIVGVGNTYTWQGPDGGQWSTPANWNNTVPGPGKVAVLSDTSAAGKTVQVGAADVTVAGVTFNSLVSGGNTIASADGGKLILNGTLTLSDASTGALLDVTGMGHAITAPVSLASKTEVMVHPSSQLTIDGTISGSSALLKTGDGTLVVGGTNTNFTGATTIAAGTLRTTNLYALGDPGKILFPPYTAATVTVQSGATLHVDVPGIKLDNLTVNGTVTTTSLADGGAGSTGNIELGTVDSSGNTVVQGTLTLGPTGLIDLKDRMLIVHYTQDSVAPSILDGPATAIKAALVQGRNVAAGGVFDGPWNGTAGITSSRAAKDFSDAHIATGSPNTEFYALGYGDTGKQTLGDGTITNKMLINDAGPNFFDPTANGGRGAGVGSTVFVRYTRVGDATMDGIVGNNDVTVLGLNFDPTYNPDTSSNGPKQWYDGDFNYNGIVDNNDVTILGLQFDPTNTSAVLYSSLVSQYGSSFAASFAQGYAMSHPTASLVPEPGALSLLGIGALALMRRRRQA